MTWFGVPAAVWLESRGFWASVIERHTSVSLTWPVVSNLQKSTVLLMLLFEEEQVGGALVLPRRCVGTVAPV
jgi:hypothetical protein